MSLKSKIEAVIYASEEPVTLQQLTGLLAEEAAAELDRTAAQQAELPLNAPDTAEAPAEISSTRADSIVSAGSAQDSVYELTPDNSPDDLSVPLDMTPSRDSGDSADADLATTPENPDSDGSPALTEAEKRKNRERERTMREHIRRAVDELMRDYAESDRGIEIREVAGGFRMGTKPEYHDAVRGFVKSLKPALKLSLQALETLAVVAYKQPITAAEISEIRGVDSAGVLGGLMTRKLIATAGRKQVIGRPMLYKTTKEFLVRFGLKDIHELPSMDEFERMAGELTDQEDLPVESTEAVIERANARGDAEHLREASAGSAEQVPQALDTTLTAGEADDEEDLATERPSEDLVTDVLGVSPPSEAEAGSSESVNPGNTAPASATSSDNEVNRQPDADVEETEPIEAVAAM